MPIVRACPTRHCLELCKGRGVPLYEVHGHSAVICAKTAEPMEMPFGLWAWMVPENHVYTSWGPNSRMGIGYFGENGGHCKVQGLSAVSCAKTADPIEMRFGMISRVERGTTY